MSKLETLKELKAKVEEGERFILGSAERAGFTAWQASTAEQVTMHGSLDAAKALHEAVLPEWECALQFNSNHAGAAVATCGKIESGDSPNPARAWLIAILSALIAQEEI